MIPGALGQPTPQCRSQVFARGGLPVVIAIRLGGQLESLGDREVLRIQGTERWDFHFHARK